MKISDQLKKAALNPHQENDVIAIQQRLENMEKEIKEAQAALQKYKSNPEKFAPQKDNLIQSINFLMKTAKALLHFAEKI